tara:strand:+ start:192 stop:590 length:399 start_codon:yes stop_codon:yes gene_type:complete
MADKILVVDDDPDIVMLLNTRLKASGYEVISASDGEEGLRSIRENKPNLVILDVMMPKMNGFQVSRMVKFDKKLKNIPIILLTARGQEKDKSTGAQVGADEYMTKPFDSKVLMATIERLLKASAAAESGGSE